MLGVKTRAAAVLPLGLVERDVGALEQSVSVRARAVEDDDADARVLFESRGR